MTLKEALANFYINEVRIVYKHDIVLLKNPSDIKIYEEEVGLIGVDKDSRDIPCFVFVILKKDIDYRENYEIHRYYKTEDGN